VEIMLISTTIVLMTVVANMGYSRSDLLHIGKRVLSAKTTFRLPLPVYRTVQDLGLSAVKPTFRGKRGVVH